MTLSMTGFGKASSQSPKYLVQAEIKSVNSRYLELSFRLPKTYFEQEAHLKNQLSSKLERGKISVSVAVQALSAEPQATVVIDAARIKEYYLQLEALNQQLGLNEPISLETLLRLPNVVAEQESSPSAEEWALVQQAVAQAADAFQASRAEEGRQLAADLKARIEAIAKLGEQVAPLEAIRIQALKQKLQASLAQYAVNEQTDRARPINEDRYEQELIYYLERADITEERVRLGIHLNLFLTTLNEEGSQGRKLGFVAQEMGREINTLGSKASHAGIQALVVQMKDELEKVKEQLMNIL